MAGGSIPDAVEVGFGSGVLDASQRVGSLTATSPPQFPSVFVEFVVRRRDDLPPRRSRHGSLPACGQQERARRRLAARQRLGRRRR